MKANIRAGIDLHAVTATRLFDEDFTDTQRGIAKGAGFGRFYGAGAATVAANAGVELAVAQRALRAFDAEYPGIRRFAHRVRGLREIITPSGRRLPLDRDRSYIGVNYYIQSTARDIFVQARRSTRPLSLDWLSRPPRRRRRDHAELTPRPRGAACSQARPRPPGRAPGSSHPRTRGVGQVGSGTGPGHAATSRPRPAAPPPSRPRAGRDPRRSASTPASATSPPTTNTKDAATRSAKPVSMASPRHEQPGSNTVEHKAGTHHDRPPNLVGYFLPPIRRCRIKSEAPQGRVRTSSISARVARARRYHVVEVEDTAGAQSSRLGAVPPTPPQPGRAVPAP